MADWKTKSSTISLSLWLCCAFAILKLLCKYCFPLLFKPACISVAYTWNRPGWKRWQNLISEIPSALFFGGGAYSHGIFEDREFWVCVEWLCVLSPHTEWLSKIRSTHNTPWHLDLYSFQPRLSHTHQPRYHLSVTRTCSPFSHLQPCSCSSTDSSKLLDSLLPHTSPLSSLDLGIISPGKPSLCWSS